MTNKASDGAREGRLREALDKITCQYCKLGFERLESGMHVSFTCGTDGIAKFRHENTPCTSKADEILATLPAVRAAEMAGARLEEVANYVALRLPERLPLRGDRNEAATVILRLMRSALAANESMPTVGTEPVAQGELRERIAKALWDNDIAEEDLKGGLRDRIDYAQWPADSAVQPYCRSTYRAADAVLAALEAQLAAVTAAPAKDAE